MQRELKVTEAQKLVIIEFMEQNGNFAKGKLLHSKKMWAAQWEILTAKLNNMNGAQKSTTKWKRSWSDLKNKVKKKAKDIRELRMRGEWPQVTFKLTDFEERLITFLADEIVFADTAIVSSPLNSTSSFVNIEEIITPEITEDILLSDTVDISTSSLNKKLDNLSDIGRELIKEHRKTNDMLLDLITELKQNNDKLY